MLRPWKGTEVRHDPREIREALKELLVPETTPRSTRTTIRETLDYIRQLEAELRKAGFAEYDKGNPTDD